MRRLLLLGLIVAGLLAGMAATRWLTQPPPLRADNAAGAFDAVRAKARLTRIIGPSPAHPADSASGDGVRARLIAELRAAGLSPRVDDRFVCNRLNKASGASCARVRNVSVTVGPVDGPHLLVNSHYDSVPVGPGASDAGLGVAAMIEAASLMKDRPLARPVTFLFNEGEEAGLLGARAFLDADPVSRRVDALINLEARGTTGPVNMFETSVPNRAAVSLFRESVTRPVANSLAVSAYRLIPNTTDVNTFVEERDWLFLNFAPIGNETRYHSPGDNLAAVDLATLQHMGDQLIEVGGALGKAPAPVRADGERLFMNVGTRWLFTAPGGTMIAAMLLVLLASLAGGGLWRTPTGQRGAMVKSAGASVALLTGVLLLPMAMAWGGLTLLGALREGQFWRAYPKAVELAIYAGVIAGGLMLLGSSRRLTEERLRDCWWGLFLLIGILFSLAASGALVYFLIPPLLYALVSGFRGRWRHASLAGNLLAATILFMTLGGMVGLLQELLNGGPLWVFGLLGGLVLIPWLIEARPLLHGWSRRKIVLAALAFVALAWVPAALVPAYSQDRQQQWTTQYVMEEGKSPVWSIVNDRKPLPAKFGRLGEWKLQTIPALGPRQRWVLPTNAFLGKERVAGYVTPLESRATPHGRLVRLKLASIGASSLVLRIPREGEVRAMGVPGRIRSIPRSERGPSTLTCTGRSCDGAEFALLVAEKPFTVEVISTWWDLPESASSLLAARPRFARPQYLPDSTILVRRQRV